jgi:hypothetical protein
LVSCLVIIDEVGCIPLDPEAAALFFELVASQLRAGFADRELEQDVLRVKGDLRRSSGSP